MNAKEIIAKRRKAYKELLFLSSKRIAINKKIKELRKELEGLDNYIIKEK